MSERAKNLLLKTLIIVGVMALSFLLRVYDLESDPPDYLSWSAAVYVDEGYKALDARNTIKYGSNHWTPYDEYRGHHYTSKIIYDIQVRIFERFGVRIVNLRYFNIAVSLGIILAMLVTLSFVFDAVTILLLGLAMAINVVMLFHSRIALYEAPMIFVGTLLLPGIFLYFNHNYFTTTVRKLLYGMVLMAVMAGMTSVGMGIKDSFALYMFSMMIAFVFAALLPFYKKRKIPHPLLDLKNFFSLLLIGILAVFVILTLWQMYVTYRHPQIAGERFFGSPVMLLAKLWFLEIIYLQPNTFLLCVLCVIAILKIFYSRRYVNFTRGELFIYQLDLFFAIQLILSFLLVYLLSYSPLRYFLFSEVAILYMAGRFVGNYEKEMRILRSGRKPAKGPIGAALIFLLVFYIAIQFVIVCVMLFVGYDSRREIFDKFYLNMMKGDISNPHAYFVFILILVVLPAVFFITKNHHDIANFVKRHLSGKLMIFLLIEVQLIYLLSWHFGKTYTLRDSMNFVKTLPANSVIMGDWAPMIAFESELKAIYSNPFENLNMRAIGKIRPDYVVLDSNKKEEEIYNAFEPGLIKPGNMIYNFWVQAFNIKIYRVDKYKGAASRPAAAGP